MKTSKILTVLLVTIMAMMVPQQTNAQFGKILKKAKKAAETILATPEQSTNKATAKVEAVTQDDGVIVENPMNSHFVVQLVGAYGRTTSTNYGEVDLIVKIKMIDNRDKIQLGQGMIAFDSDGNQYKTEHEHIGKWFNVSEGMFVRLNLSDENLALKDVKKSATMLQQIKLRAWINSDIDGHIVFKNVPIQWDVEPK